MRRLSSLIALVPLIVVVLAMELAARLEWVPRFLLPAPSDVLARFVSQFDLLLQATATTALASLIGFAVSGLLGVLVAIALNSNRWIEKAFYPYAVFLQTVPIVAIAPLLVIWVGNNINAVIVAATIVAIFPIIANTLTGLRSTDPALRDLFALYDAGPLASLFKLRLPSALPNIFTGLRIGAGLSVVGAIVGEFITTGSGLGGTMIVARQANNVQLVFAALILSAVLGIALFLLVNLVSFVTLRRWNKAVA